MSFTPETAAIRFGTGLSPTIEAPVGVETMLAGLAAPDLMASRFPIGAFSLIEGQVQQLRELNKIRREAPERNVEIKKKINALYKQSRGWQIEWLQASMARSIYTEDGLRERLTRFWADHFTVRGKKSFWRYGASTYVEAAIRPHLSGKFSDLLKAALFHPMMLMYLDQVNSVGPKSVVAALNPKRGLNENLAREVLELHTLGVDGAYSQSDVLELAKLFSGLTYRRKNGFIYAPRMAEPGPETVLGKSYGGYIQDLFHVTDFLDDLAVHPDTARHLARKLVVHFVSDAPDAAHIEHVATAYRESGGDLMQAYRAMLTHKSAWEMPAAKVKQPFEFICAALRALGVDEKEFTALSHKKMRGLVIAPMGLMGQPWEKPNGPDGWTEAAEHWITPQGLAARIQWAMVVPPVLQVELPDPVGLADVAIGGRVTPDLLQAVRESTPRSSGVGLVFASPEFQRN